MVTDAQGNTETFDSYVTQDADGNISFLDEDGDPVSLERVGPGAIITYRSSAIVPPEAGTDCDMRVQATARLDTRTNTLTAEILLTGLGCLHRRERHVATATKLS